MEIEVFKIVLHLFLVVGGGILAGVLAILCIILFVTFGVWLASLARIIRGAKSDEQASPVAANRFLP